MISRVLILADESAHWEVAGLRQLERLLLALEERAREQRDDIEVAVFWRPGTETKLRSLAQAVQARLQHLKITEVESHGEAVLDLVLSTRLLLRRTALTKQPVMGAFRSPAFSGTTEVERWDRAAASIAAANAHKEDKWRLVGERAADERWLLTSSGKPQDGWVSRHLNRPISRAITHHLLRLPITPMAWTLAIFVLPIAACALALRGTYSATVCALLVFQAYSILDGCDGEIARAKFAETDRGRAIDMWCDTFAMMLLAIGIGAGHSRAWEGIVVAILILTNEVALRINDRAAGGNPAIYPRHHEMIAGLGILRLGATAVDFLLQVTKRDVAILLFVALAVLDRPRWIVHLVGAVTAATLVLQANAFRLRTASR